MALRAGEAWAFPDQGQCDLQWQRYSQGRLTCFLGLKVSRSGCRPACGWRNFSGILKKSEETFKECFHFPGNVFLGGDAETAGWMGVYLVSIVVCT